MDLIILFLICAITIIIGVFANIGGFGGGILLIPILTLFFGFPFKVVAGTVLSSLFLPAFIGVIFAARRKEINYTVAILIEIPTVIGILIGSRLAEQFSDNQLKGIFGSVALVVSISMLRKSYAYNSNVEQKRSHIWVMVTELKPILSRSTEAYEYKISIPFAILSGLFIGLLAGMLGISGGWLKAPIMILGFSIPPVIASGTALFMILITSLTGGLVHFYGDNWDFNLFIMLTLSLSIGSILGDQFKSKMKSHHIALVLAVVLLLIAVFTLVDVFI